MNMYNDYVFYHRPTTIKIATELRNVGDADYALSRDKALYKSTDTLLYFTLLYAGELFTLQAKYHGCQV